MMADSGKLKYLEKACPGITMSTKKSTCTALG
jgi:hypothetical protein